jgi:hypothetical protein
MKPDVLCLFEFDLQKGPQELVTLGTLEVSDEILKNAITECENVQILR